MKFLKRTLLIATTLSLSAGLAGSSLSAPSVSGKIGLVLGFLNVAVYQAPENKEGCPLGGTLGDEEQFSKTFPSAEQQYEQLENYGTRSNRGPGGANAYYNPLTVVDPVQHYQIAGKIGYGVNLDGTADGHATDATCTHEKFTTPDGETGIDNQLYRLVGCADMFRHGGLMETQRTREFAMPINRWLIEITNVADENNSPDVQVNFYLGRDPLPNDANGETLPWTSQRIDYQYPQYMAAVKGKIVDGVVITEPLDLKRWPIYQINAAREFVMKDMRLRIKLTPGRGDAIMAGYVDAENWYREFLKYGARVMATKMSGPNMYRAMWDLADGHKDPATGKCTALSAAYRLTMARAYIVHDEYEDKNMRDRAKNTLASK